MDNLTVILDNTTLSFLAAVLVAAVCGAVLGAERQWRGRVAGLRTNLLVCIGSAIFTYLSITAFTNPFGDTGRVAAQIVSGIGFLGAGVVLRRGDHVQGLNTAATIWASAALGMAAGAGMYGIALIGSVIIVISQVVLRPIGAAIDQHVQRGQSIVRYHLNVMGDAQSAGPILDVLENGLNQVDGVARIRQDTQISRQDGAFINWVLSGRPADMREFEKLLQDVIGLENVHSVSWSEEQRETPLRRRLGRNSDSFPATKQ